MMNQWLYRLALPLLASAASIAGAAEPTRVTIGEEVILKDVPRIGINISGDAYYQPPALKRRLSLNFEEGDITNFLLWQPRPKDMPANHYPLKRADRYSADAIATIKKDGQLVVMEGDRIFESFKIKDVVIEGDSGHLVLDGDFPAPVGQGGHATMAVLLAPRLPMTEVQERDKIRGPLLNKKDTESFTLAPGDVPPGSFGNHAFKVAGSGGKRTNSWILTGGKSKIAPGEWKVELWAKAAAGDPKLDLSIGNAGFSPELTDQWQRIEKTVNVTETGDGWLGLEFQVSGGDVLMDDIAVTKLGFKNPTAFTDEFVEQLRDDLKIGILRQLIMGRRFDDYLGDVNRHTNPVPWTITEYYAMCEYIGAEPWHSLPGYVTREDMQKMVEYLAAPADVGYGKIRAAQGHPKPWTDVFKHIYIQVANEPITFNGNSPAIEYWRQIADAARSSPHWKDNIVITASHQDISTGNWTGRGGYKQPVPKLGAAADVGYFLKGLWPQDLSRYEKRGDFFQWLVMFSEEAWNKGGKWVDQMHELGYDVIVYETNFHTTFGSVPSKDRDAAVVSFGGSMAQIHNLLHPMKEHRVLAQCFFTLFQFNFSPGGSFGDKFPGDKVRLWGVSLGQTPEGIERYRPAALGIRTINEVIGGNLVNTTHAGADPEIAVMGRWVDGNGTRQPDGGFRKIPTEETSTRTAKAIRSYGFKEGNRRGLILTNLDAHNAQPVVIEFDGTASGSSAKAWLHHHEDVDATNEPEAGKPQIEVKEQTLSGFKSGHELTLPAFSVMAIEWEVE